MAELLKKTEAEAEHLEKEAAQLGKGAMQNKMKIVGAIASGLSICMYVSYIPQIMNNLHGMKGTPIQPLVAAINCTLWVTYALLKKNRDYPVAMANAPGIIFGLIAAITAII